MKKYNSYKELEKLFWSLIAVACIARYIIFSTSLLDWKSLVWCGMGLLIAALAHEFVFGPAQRNAWCPEDMSKDELLTMVSFLRDEIFQIAQNEEKIVEHTIEDNGDAKLLYIQFFDVRSVLMNKYGIEIEDLVKKL